VKIRFFPNRSFEKEVAQLGSVVAAVTARAEAAASAAENIGQGVASSYSVDVSASASGARLDANTGGINAAKWIEFGNSNLPAAAPLRKGIESAGLRLKEDG
jgi:hypothetical protein